MPHPRCIIIASDVTIGNHVHVGQYVTIGGNFKRIKQLPNGKIQKLPIIGNKVMIHPGAVIGGPVTLVVILLLGRMQLLQKIYLQIQFVLDRIKQQEKKLLFLMKVVNMKLLENK